jgi:aminoglycoside phosphotransferase
MDDSLPDTLPDPLRALIAGQDAHEVLIGWSGVRVFRLSGGSYLKINTSPDIDLRPEKDRLVWLAGRLPVPEMRYFSADDACQFMLMSEIPGLPSFDDRFKKGEEARIVALMAEGLRMIHAVDWRGCPFDQRNDVMIETAHTRLVQGLFDEVRLDPSRRGRDAQELFAQLVETRPPEEDLVFAHGDYCLPNILVDPERWTLTGFIDWGSAGIADRYLDLGLAARSLAFNFGPEWVQPFFDAYGLDEPDPAKIEFYQLLDEFY